MTITTWNVNSVRARQDRIVAWLAARAPDVVCFQELKCLDSEFPRPAFEALGYHVETFGQKTYNGVAILSLSAPEDVIRGIPDAEQSRGISAVVDGVRIVNLYVVNGQDTASDRYTYKLDWLRRTTERVSAWAGGPLVVCGDYNIAPDDLDCYDPEGWKGKIHCSEPEREAFRGLLALGLTDAYRAHHAGEAGRYTWWDYRGDMYGQHKGLRIDHHLVSAPVAGRVTEVSIDSEERGLQGASDHAPVTLHLR